jgi:hypothetical protein
MQKMHVKASLVISRSKRDALPTARTVSVRSAHNLAIVGTDDAEKHAALAASCASTTSRMPIPYEYERALPSFIAWRPKAQN